MISEGFSIAWFEARANDCDDAVWFTSSLLKRFFFDPEGVTNVDDYLESGFFIDYLESGYFIDF